MTSIRVYTPMLHEPIVLAATERTVIPVEWVGFVSLSGSKLLGVILVDIQTQFVELMWVRAEYRADGNWGEGLRLLQAVKSRFQAASARVNTEYHATLFSQSHFKVFKAKNQDSWLCTSR